ncbi:mechanosensitive ion channel family protein [Natronomonas sp. F2-12]|jgi:small-conductance mechanosensitive channel|uniref:Mechanosensitive ion channel family protein n=1 Tax=Natronomonas aquatica TaxID=2841590 RepID=A0A9R1D4Y1_9EURY|nr:mechanosensitive ion channel family protein [Natronomonas aquatica]MCQ4332471.1 mechanosensitive ion channel family protein [Natronomonas aquatica]
MNGPLVSLQTEPSAPDSTLGGGPGLSPPGWLPDLVPVSLYRLVAAAALVVFAYYLSRLARQVLGRRIARRFKRPSVAQTVLRGMQGAIVLGAVLTALSFFGIGFGNIALSVGVFSAVVGIVLAPIIGNIISGVFVLSEQPYEIGDMIGFEDTGTRGFVEEITLVYTKMFTLDNTFIVLPNGTMRERDVVNYSAEDTRIRMTLNVGVTYESDIDVAREQMEAAARSVEGVIRGGPDIRIGSARYPASPTCYIRQFGDSEVSLRLRYWAEEPYKQTAVRSRVMADVWNRFEEHGVEIPYPHSHMVFDDTSGELQVSMRESEAATESRPGGATARDEAEPQAEAGTETEPETEPRPRPDTEDDATGSR